MTATFSSMEKMLGIPKHFEGEFSTLTLPDNVTVRISKTAIQIIVGSGESFQSSGVGNKTLIMKGDGPQVCNQTYTNNKMSSELQVGTFKISCTDDKDLENQLRAKAIKTS